MIATPVDALPKGPLPRPELVVTRNAVAEALDHMRLLRKCYSEIRAAELARIGKDVKVVKLAPCVARYKHGSSKFDELLK